MPSAYGKRISGASYRLSFCLRPRVALGFLATVAAFVLVSLRSVCRMPFVMALFLRFFDAIAFVAYRLQTVNYVLRHTCSKMFGEELRKARETAGMTQEELAFKASLDRTYISRLEHDRKSPTLDSLFRLADALGIAASTLIERVERSRRKG